MPNNLSRGAAALSWAVLAAAAPAPDPAAPANKEAALFGAREAVQQISLSPDGLRVAVVTPNARGTGTTLMVANVETGEVSRILSSSGDPDRLRYCRWATATRLVCGVSIVDQTGTGRLGFTRLVSLDHDGSDLKQLSAPTSGRALGVAQNGGGLIDWLGDDAGGAVLMTRTFVPEETTGTHLASSREGLGVERVDTATSRRAVVEPPSATAVEYITDGHGGVRIRGLRPRTNSGYDGDTVSYAYRTAGSRDWKPLSRVVGGATGVGSGFDPYAVDRALDVAYGFDRLDGRQALYKVSLDGSLKRELVFAHPEVDVDDLVRIGRQNRVVGVSFATDRRRTEFFDPELKRLLTSLGKALPDAPLLTFVDASADEGKLLLWAGGDTNAGRYYLYDKATRRLAEVLPSRPQLAGVKLAAVKPVRFPAADGASIPGYLTLPAGKESAKGLPALVMPHGGPGARDEWGFDWLAQYFAARGFAVLQPNFRGSTGYGDGWFQKNGFQSWRTAVGDVNAGGRWLVSQGVADPAKLAILGWSYGGYAALQSPALDPSLFKAIVAVAPVTDLEALRAEARDFTSYALVDAFIGRGPHVRAGSPAQNVGTIAAPVLMFHGDRDDNVGVNQARLMASRLKGAGKRVELVEFKGLDHQLDDAAARQRMLTRADEFLRAELKLP